MKKTPLKNKTLPKKITKKKLTTSLPAAKPEDKFTIYHNTRCSKSREACSILEEKGVEFDTIEYLKTPLQQKEIKELLQLLGIKAEALIRKSEPLFKEKYDGKKLTEAQWIKAMAENSILIERPIIVKGNKAIIGRPVERVVEFIK